MPFLKTSQKGLRLIPSIITTAAGPLATNTFGQDLTLPTSGTGQVQPTYVKPFVRGSLGLYSAATSVGNAAITATNDAETPATNLIIKLKTLNSSGSSASGLVRALFAGWDSSFTASSPFPRTYEAKCSQPGASIYALAWNSTSSTITEGASFFTRTSVSDGLDDFAINKPFAQDNLVVLITPWHASSPASATITSATASNIRTALWDLNSVAAADHSFHALVLGFNRAGQTGGRFAAIRTPQPKARLHAIRIVTTGGVPVITLGNGDATIVDTGVGRYTLTWTKPFKRKPIVVATGTAANRAVLRGEPSVTGCEINSWNAAGSALADGGIEMLVYGCDTDIQV